MQLTEDILSQERLAKQLEQHERYRVLRAVPHAQFNMPPGAPPDGTCIALVDVETSGLDIDQHEVVELAILLVWVDLEGEVIAHHKPVSWLHEPAAPLEPIITRITGLTDEDLRGKCIDDGLAVALLDRADLLVAHNASFDRAWIEQRYPSVVDKPWACSVSEINWLRLGFEGRSQQHLLWQHGWFSSAHRAADDTWSLLHLLRQNRTDPATGEERTHLSRLLQASARSTEMVEAIGAPFSGKDRLKARGYKWNSKGRFWHRELDPSDLVAEREWFATAGLPPFRSRTLTACDRHR